jgi:hypothetical protein
LSSRDHVHQATIPGVVVSNPPTGKKALVNIYFDPDIGPSGEWVFVHA